MRRHHVGLPETDAPGCLRPPASTVVCPSITRVLWEHGARTWRRARVVVRLSALSVFLAAAGWSCPHEECSCVPDVSEIEIIPAQLVVLDGETFELRARLKDPTDQLIPEFFSYRPKWEFSPADWITVLDWSGHAVTIRPRLPSESPSGIVTVMAEATPGVSTRGPATITVVKGAPSEDRIVTDHGARSSPEVALVEDGSGTAYTNPLTFVAMAPLGNLNDPDPARDPAGGVMVFSETREMGFDKAPWTSTSGEEVNYSPASVSAFVDRSLGQPLNVPVTVWIDPTAPSDDWTAISAEALARIQVADASRTFALNRAGVRFSVASVRILETELEGDCLLVDLSSVRGFDGVSWRGFDHTQVNVFYVDMGNGTGQHCDPVTIDGHPQGFRIFMSSSHPFPTTLTHELGHLMSLDHTSSLGSHNVMWEGDNDEPQPRRSHLTLGQVCKTNLDANSRLFQLYRSGSVPTCPSETLDLP